MNAVQIILLVGVILLADTMIIGAMLAVGGSTWRGFARYFPEQAELAGAERKTWQTIRLGCFNWGGCFEISIDSEHVHLRPGARIGRFIGRSVASIPLAAFGQLKSGAGDDSRRARRSDSRELRLAGQRVLLPRWVFDAVMPRL
jgi:hypothetical protein